jgi:predicted nucleic-acid-binding protein
MIGADTNVLVRAVLNDHPQESRKAINFLKKAAQKKQLFISSYAILEMVWVLKVRKRDREEIIEAIMDLLDSPGIVIGRREVVVIALEMYAKGKADFGDYLIMAEGELFETPYLASFDKTLCKDTRRASPPSKFEW